MIVDGSYVRPKFELGRVVVTANCLHTLVEAIGVKRQDVEPEMLEMLAQLSIQPLLRRHTAGDWGDVDAEDAQANEQALKHGARILSIYRPHGVKVYVITDGLSDACPACWAGTGECEPDKGTWQGSVPGASHFRDDLPPARLSTTVLLPEDY